MPRRFPRLGRQWRKRLAFALAAAVALQPGSIAAETPLEREDRIKAALIVKLIKFVEWPTDALAGRDPIQICAIGSSGVGDALARIDGKAARDRVASFRRVDGSAAGEAKGCHVLFIPAGTRDLWAALRGRGVLTVSDVPDFARRGGMIGLVRSENRVAFEINLRSARDAGLAPGAPLLELATVVE